MLKKIKRISLIILVLLSSITIKAQNFNRFTEKLQFGGDFGMSFGTYMYINVSPIVYYNVSDDFVLGLGVDYTYFKDNSYPGFTYESSIWSPRFIARYFIGDNIFVHGEIQQMFYKDVYGASLNPDAWISRTKYYAGAGYRQWMTTNSYSFIMLLFDLENTDFNFGINPQIQMGFAVGL